MAPKANPTQRQIKAIRTHIGVQLVPGVFNSVDSEKQNVEMELWPMGVYVCQKVSPKGPVEFVIPYPNVQQITLLPVEPEPAK